jgi:TPR repeat protein
VRVKGTSGWESIDPTLAAIAGRIAPKATLGGLSLSGGGSGPVARLHAGGQRLSVASGTGLATARHLSSAVIGSQMDNQPINQASRDRTALQRRVQQGDPQAMAQLGQLMLRDNQAEGEQLIRRSAELGSWEAANYLMMTAPTVALHDHWRNETLRLALVESERGNAGAASAAAYILAASDKERAIGLARQAAEAGDALAMDQLSVLLADRSGSEAGYWEDRAVAAGNAGALCRRAARLYDDDRPAAMELFRQAARKGHPYAMVRLGYECCRGGDLEGARKWYQLAAENGQPAGDRLSAIDAMRRLGDLLADKDEVASLRWLQAAATRGDVEAMKTFARHIEKYDYDTAIRWIRAACEAGDREACTIYAKAPKIASFSTKAHNRKNRDKLPLDLYQ